MDGSVDPMAATGVTGELDKQVTPHRHVPKMVMRVTNRQFGQQDLLIHQSPVVSRPSKSNLSNRSTRRVDAAGVAAAPASV